MREQEIELLNHIIDFNAMGAFPLIEAQVSLIKAFEILQEQLGTFSPDFLETPIVNSFIRSKYNETNFIQTNRLDAMEQKIKDIDDLINNFKSALSTKTSAVINTMWNNNPLLQAWYRGQPVDFGNNQFPQMRTISLVDLISNFKSVLFSKKAVDVLQTMWDGNDRLHQAIKSLDRKQFKSLFNQCNDQHQGWQRQVYYYICKLVE